MPADDLEPKRMLHRRVGRGLERVFRYQRQRGVDFQDDRGKPVRADRGHSTESFMSGLLAEADPGGERKRRLHRLGLLVLNCIMLAYVAPVLFPSLGLPVLWRPSIFFSLVFTASIIASTLLHRRGMGAASALGHFCSDHASTLVAAGRCGSCGYPLEGLAVEADGCIECPECGAAWHRDRRVWGEGAAGTAQMASRLRPLDASVRRSGITSDDRGVILAIVATWPRSIFSKDLPQRFREPITVRLDRVRRQRSRVAFMVLGVCWIAGVVAVVRRVDPRDVMYPIVPVTLIAMMIAYLIHRVTLPTTRVREAFLDVCCCPACCSKLERAEPQFDGCIVCSSCRHAWRLDGLGKPPRDPELPLVPGDQDSL